MFMDPPAPRSRTSRYRTLVAVAMAFAPTPAIADDPPSVEFDRLSIEQGLSQSIVEDILQDRTGFMWFVTEDGLNRFDGYSFSVYRNEAGDPTTLSHNELKSVYEDRTGILWVGAFAGGLNRFDPTTGTVTRYTYDPTRPEGLAAETVRSVVEDREGHLWVGTQGGGLECFDPDGPTFHHHRHEPLNPSSLPDDDVRALIVSSTGTLWVGTMDGLARRETGRDDFTRVGAPGAHDALPDQRVLALLEDSAGRLWIGTAAGLAVLEDDLSRVRRLPAPDGGESIRDVFEDHAGTVWVASDGGGLGRVDRGSKTVTWYRHDPLDASSLPTDRVWSLYQDRSHVLWVGTYGGGLARFDVARKRFRHIRHDADDPTSLGHDIVWCFWKAPDGGLWVGTDSAGLDRRDPRTRRWSHFRHDPDDPRTIGSDTVRALWGDRSDRLWIATNGGGLSVRDLSTGRMTRYRHDPHDPTSLAADDLRSVMQDSTGTIWVGTFGGGLDRFDPSTGGFRHMRSHPTDRGSLASDFIRLTYEDRHGDLWVGTQGGGLSRLDRSTDRFTTFRHHPDDPSSLSNDHVFTILETAAGNFWVGTFGGGLNRLDRATGRFTHLGARDGLASDSVYAMLEDDDGNLWISTTRGLSRLDPRTGEFRNFDVRDGLQANEFNGGAAYRSPDGELFFGGINGFNSFFPDEITSNPVVPQVVLTNLELFNRVVVPGQPLDDGRVLLDRPLTWVDHLQLSYRDAVFSLQFAALHFTAPTKNRYRYTLEGYHDRWIPVSAQHRLATFTGLPPGDYTFRVAGSNADGVWNERGATLRITVTPPFWATWWFRLALAAIAVAAIAAVARARTRSVRMRAELQAAHDAQMSIMPQTQVEIPGFEVSGVCLPAHEVGGDFFDSFWMGTDPHRLCVVLGDAAGKAMTAAMTAVMSDGMIVARADQPGTVADIMSSLNRTLYAKVPERMFTALCLMVLDPGSRQLEVADAGLCEPLLCSSGEVVEIAPEGARYPLGRFADTTYRSRTVSLGDGDAIVAFTDGVPEARDRAGHLYGYDAPRRLLQNLDTSRMTASAIRDTLIEDVRSFSAGTAQSDDITVVVIAARSMM